MRGNGMKRSNFRKNDWDRDIPKSIWRSRGSFSLSRAHDLGSFSNRAKSIFSSSLNRISVLSRILNRQQQSSQVLYSSSYTREKKKEARNKCDQMWRNFITLAKFCKTLGNFSKPKLVLDKILSLLWQIFMLSIGQISNVINGPILKNNQAIWSHCTP